MQVQTMEASISNELLEDEELLWSGRPDPQRRRIVSPARVFLILGLVFLPIGLVAVLIGLALLLSSVIPPDSQAVLLGLFIPGGVFFVLGLIYLIIGLVGFFPSRNALYAITNRRVIILRPGRYTRASSYGKRAITQVHRIERPDGSGDIVIQTNSLVRNNNTVSQFKVALLGIPNVKQVVQQVLALHSQRPAA